MNQIKNFVAMLLIFIGMSVTAQDNIVKAGFTGALLGDFTIGIERRLSNKTSLQFKAGFLEPTLSPVIPEKAFTPRAYNLLEANGGINSSIEYRFFLSGRKGMQGFYIAPYLRYFNLNMVFDDEIEGYVFTVDTRLSTFGAGGQLGYQWIFNEVFAIDLYFFGTGIDFHKAEIEYELEPAPPGFDYSMVTPHVDDVFSDTGFLYKRLTHEVRDDSHYSRLPFAFPGFRAGLSIGVAF